MADPATTTMQALRQLSKGSPPTIETVAIPEAIPGAGVVRIIYANIISYTQKVYDGTLKYSYPTPLTLGFTAIARVHDVGKDAVSLQPGQLILVDAMVRARDNPEVAFLSAVHEGHLPGASRLMKDVWRDGTWAKYAKVPIENCHALNEQLLLGPVAEGGLGYSMEDLAIIPRFLVSAGGLFDIGLRAGETIVVAPATGGFGGAGVHVALAMGAKVIAMGRNIQALDALKSISNRIATVPITGNIEEELAALGKHGPIDAYLDISPQAAANASYFKAAILCLRHGGRVSLMGGQRTDVAIPHSKVMHWDLKLQGKWMYERSDVQRAIKLVEQGNLKIGIEAGFGVTKKFSLGDWKMAFEEAGKDAATSSCVFEL